MLINALTRKRHFSSPDNRQRPVGLVLLLIATFVAVNWAVFARSAKVSFVFTSVEVPVGTVMVGIFAPVALTFDVYSAFLERDTA
jgi:hypothetical protein